MFPGTKKIPAEVAIVGGWSFFCNEDESKGDHALQNIALNGSILSLFIASAYL